MRKIVLIGNCQVQSVYNLYMRFAEQASREALHYIRSYEHISKSDLDVILQADVLVEQIQDFKTKNDLSGMDIRAERIGIPVVHCGFLWPFAGQAHPANPTSAFLASGPYGSEMSDAFLNRLIKKHVAAEAAVAQYEALDVNKTVNLDRLLEVVLEKQTIRDNLTGYSIAPLIADFFRTEQIFLTPYHPNIRIAMSLATQAFVKLGVGSSDIALMVRATRKTPFPKEELPVHPAVARHFGLRWATPDRRYCLLSEGAFTFPEFARRYVLCDWNPSLEEGLSHARRREWEPARELLAVGIEKSPDSAPGYGSLGHVLEQIGDRQGALAAITKAVALDPDAPAYRVQLGLLLEHAGDYPGAEAEFREAAALEPYDAHFPGMLAHFMLRRQRYREALEAARNGLAHFPRAGNLHAIAGHALGKLGDLAGADASYRKASRLMPANAAPLIALAELYEAADQAEAAIGALRAALVAQPNEPQTLSRLGVLLGRTGQPEEAAAIWQTLAEAKPADLPAQLRIVTGLMQAGRVTEAVAAAQNGLSRFGPSVELLRQLATGLDRSARLEEAIAVLQDNDPVVSKDAGYSACSATCWSAAMRWRRRSKSSAFSSHCRPPAPTRLASSETCSAGWASTPRRSRPARSPARSNPAIGTATPKSVTFSWRPASSMRPRPGSGLPLPAGRSKPPSSSIWATSSPAPAAMPRRSRPQAKPSRSTRPTHPRMAISAPCWKRLGHPPLPWAPTRPRSRTNRTMSTGTFSSAGCWIVRATEQPRSKLPSGRSPSTRRIDGCAILSERAHPLNPLQASLGLPCLS